MYLEYFGTSWWYFLFESIIWSFALFLFSSSLIFNWSREKGRSNYRVESFLCNLVE